MTHSSWKKFFLVTTLFWVVLGCAAQPSPATAPTSPSQTASPTLEPAPTFTPTPLFVPTIPTSTVEPAQTNTPDEESSLSGMVIYDDTRNFIVFDLVTGKKRILLSRQDLVSQLPADRSAESYTFGTAQPLRVFFSPDFTKARISICANLDEYFRCGFREFVYDIAQKTLSELQMPSDMYGVAWQWSPDGSKLAGAGWTYLDGEYTYLRYYAVDSNGANLRPLSTIVTSDWQSAWHPGGQAILPFASQIRFNTILVDGSGTSRITIEELQREDKTACLAFSADYQQVAFVARRTTETSSHDWAYIARSDFEFPSMVFDFDMDPRYHCEISWSPNQKFLHLHYKPGWQDTFDFEADQPNLPPLDFVYDIETTGTLLNTPQSSNICGWTPDSKLIFTRNNPQTNATTIGLFDPATSSTVNLPDNLQRSLRGCPVAWVSSLNIELPEEVQASNACKPGETIQDIEEVSLAIPYYDIQEVTTSLEGEQLRATIRMRGSSPQLTDYLTPGVENFTNGWDILVDIDNNILTGDQAGAEYRLVANVVPEGSSRARLIGSVLQFAPQTSIYNPIGNLAISLDPATNSLLMSGIVPGITPDARIVITSRIITSVTNSRPNIAGDVVCE